MAKIIIPLVFDSLFTSFFVFLGLFSLSSSFLERKIALPLCITLGVFFLYFFTFLHYKRLKKNYASFKEKTLAENFLFTLPLLTKEEQQSFFTAIRKNNGEKELYLFKTAPITVDDVLPKTNGTGEPFTFYATDFDKACLKFFSRFPSVKLVYGKELFSLAKEKNAIPVTLSAKRVKVTLKEICSNLLKKENSKKLFFFAVFFISFSFITPFKLYYALSGCVFLALSLVGPKKS